MAAERNFSNISREECLSVSKKMLESSKQSWKTAGDLARLENFAMAMSASIISTEEMMKALILHLDGKGFDFSTIKGMDSFFRNHDIRFVLAYLMFIMSLFGDDLIKFLEKVKDNPNEIKMLSKIFKSDNPVFERKMKFYFLKKLVIIRRELHWFSKVEFFRQNGFYTDLNTEVSSPVDISADQFFEVYERLHKVRKIGRQAFKILDAENEALQKSIADMQVKLRRQNFYEHFADVLSNLRKTRTKPFDFLKGRLTAFLSDVDLIN